MGIMYGGFIKHDLSTKKVMSCSKLVSNYPLLLSGLKTFHFASGFLDLQVSNSWQVTNLY